MKSPGVRERLQAIATKGDDLVDTDARKLNEVLVKEHQPAFIAWARFSTPIHGEPLVAPSELLTPLP